MKHNIDVNLTEIWHKVPAARRHLYFFVLLALVTMVVANFQDDLAAYKRLIPPTPEPPRITSQEVYPAPVKI